jgi:putative flavoprotein involved in K+ transport
LSAQWRAAPVWFHGDPATSDRAACRRRNAPRLARRTWRRGTLTVGYTAAGKRIVRRGSGKTEAQGGRVVVVGGGNPAVQITVELAEVADVSISTRHPLRWQPQRILGKDFHWWLARTGLDTSALGPRLAMGGVPVVDEGRYRAAVLAGRPDHRALFVRLDGDSVVWADGTREQVDAIVLATGFRPDLRFLDGTRALDESGGPLHNQGVSTTVPGLGYVGLERQRSFASATLRGVGRDATHVLKALARHVAPAQRVSR